MFARSAVPIHRLSVAELNAQHCPREAKVATHPLGLIGHRHTAESLTQRFCRETCSKPVAGSPWYAMPMNRGM